MTKKISLLICFLIIFWQQGLAIQIDESTKILGCIKRIVADPESENTPLETFANMYNGINKQQLEKITSSLITNSESIGDERIMCISEIFAGVCFLNNGWYNDALEHFSNAQNFSHDNHQRDYIDYLRAVCYIAIGKNDITIQYLENIISYGAESNNPFTTMLYCESLRLCAKYYETIGNEKLAYRHLNKYCQISDTIALKGTSYGYIVPYTLYEKYYNRNAIQPIANVELVKDKNTENNNTNSSQIPIIITLVALVGIMSVVYKFAHNKRVVATKEPELDLEISSFAFAPMASLLNNTSNAVSIVDANGILTWVNGGFEKLYGYTRGEFILAYGDNAFVISKIDGRYEAFENCMISKKCQTVVTRLKTGINTDIWVQSTITPIINNNEIVKYVVEDVDISKYKNEATAITTINSQLQASLRNASTIQKLLLPSKINISQDFDNFIIFSPKDFVSGDFYWYNKIGDSFYIALGDCTGHGPSASLLNVLSTKTLDEIIISRNILNPKEILYTLDEIIIKTLRKRDVDNCDGLDITICKITPNENGAHITIAGAQSFFIYTSSGKTTMIKGVKRSIGGIIGFQMKHQFENNEIDLLHGDRIYLTSDGIIDQNNKLRKSLGSRRFCSIVHDSSQLTIADQQKYILDQTKEWAQGEPQRDDICVIGLTI